MNFARPNLAAAPRRGFTFVELMLGLLVTALVMGSLSVLLAAVAQGWQQGEATQKGSTLTAQTHLRLQWALRGATLIGAVREGSLNNTAAKNAAVLIWKNDANRDWKVQLSEVALLEYFPSNNAKDAVIRYYQAKPVTVDQVAHAAADQPTNDLYDDANIDAFRSLDYVKDSYTVLARNVLGCAFHKNDAYTATRPTIDYMFRITGPSGTETELGAVSLRTPATVPVQQR